MSNPFWMADEQPAAIASALPKNRRGAQSKRNHKVISGIIHILEVGCRWGDRPPRYGPHTIVYNLFNRWSKAGIRTLILAKLLVHDAVDIQCIDSTTAKAHRYAVGGKGGPGAGHRQERRRAHNQDPRRSSSKPDTQAGTSVRQGSIRGRNIIEQAFSHIKD